MAKVHIEDYESLPHETNHQMKVRQHWMKATGIVRRIDDLGRVVIPKEIRRHYVFAKVILWKYLWIVMEK